MPTDIPDEALDLVDGANVAQVATVMTDGSPQLTPVWIDRDGPVLRFNTAHGRAKARNLQRDPRVALTVVDPANPYRYLQIRGRAELVDDGAEAHIDALAKKYLGVDSYPMRQADERRVTVRIQAERVDYHGPRS
jgi:PPOX class probable F420-dependent enzyme